MAYRHASIARLQFRDFVPAYAKARAHGEPGLCDDIASAVTAAGQWIHDEQIDVVNVETVVLPDIHRQGGASEGQLAAGDGLWYQLVRVWFKRAD